MCGPYQPINWYANDSPCEFLIRASYYAKLDSLSSSTLCRATESQFVTSGFVSHLRSRSFRWPYEREEMSRARWIVAAGRTVTMDGDEWRANSEAARHARLANRSAAAHRSFRNRFDPHDRQREVVQGSARSRVWRANFHGANATTFRVSDVRRHLVTRDAERFERTRLLRYARGSSQVFSNTQSTIATNRRRTLQLRRARKRALCIAVTVESDACRESRPTIYRSDVCTHGITNSLDTWTRRISEHIWEMHIMDICINSRIKT